MDSNNIINYQFANYSNSFWLVLITMLTVVYGDIVPNSHFGRFVAGIIGMLLISIFVVTMSRLVEMSRDEKRAYNIILKKEINRATKQLAANMIKSIFNMLVIKA
jgi:hypothetical protein